MGEIPEEVREELIEHLKNGYKERMDKKRKSPYPGLVTGGREADGSIKTATEDVAISSTGDMLTTLWPKGKPAIGYSELAKVLGMDHQALRRIKPLREKALTIREKEKGFLFTLDAVKEFLGVK